MHRLCFLHSRTLSSLIVSTSQLSVSEVFSIVADNVHEKRGSQCRASQGASGIPAACEKRRCMPYMMSASHLGYLHMCKTVDFLSLTFVPFCSLHAICQS